MCLAVPGRVMEIETREGQLWGRVNFDGLIKQINLSFTPEVNVGEYVLIHAGFSIAVLNEEEARASLESFRGEFIDY